MDRKTQFKEAVKTALAMTMAYGIALQMGWDKPMWAGFAVAFCSLATIGQSFNKAVLRMSGSLVAAVAALTLIALFAQQRWLFMLFLSAYVGFCTYMMGGTKNQYFWNVCGFVCVIICMDAGPDSINAFNLAILRAQQTGLGILVYSLVALFLWPTSSGAQFDAAARKLATSQHQLYQAYFGLMNGEDHARKIPPLRAQVIQEQTRFGQLIDAAATDTYEVWEVRRQWRRYQGQASQLTETMERWRENFSPLPALDMQRLISNLAPFGVELDRRFTQIKRMLANQAPEQRPAVIDPVLDEVALGALAHFQKAALAVTRTRLQHLEALTRSLFDSLYDIKGFGRSVAAADIAGPLHAGFVLDADRMVGVLRVAMTMWLAYFALIYLGDLPGGTGVVTMSAVFAMAMGNTPQLSVSKFFVPAAVSISFASGLYIFVMPQLSSFTGLGPLIFAATFVICYLFAAPRQALGRALGLAMFVSIASISNQQSYSFMVAANTALMFPLVFLLLAITACIPFSPRPERAFLRLLGRFFRSCEVLTAAMRWGPQRPVTRLGRWKKAYHTREVSALPRKLGAWARFIDPKALPGTSPQQVQQLVTSLQALTYRMQELTEAGANPQASFLVQELRDDVRDWRLALQKNFQRLSQDPAVSERKRLQGGLSQIMQHLEVRVAETLDQADGGQFGARDGEHFYSLLGAYRGVSEALAAYAASAGVIDWSRWREERFS